MNTNHTGGMTTSESRRLWQSGRHTDIVVIPAMTIAERIALWLGLLLLAALACWAIWLLL